LNKDRKEGKHDFKWPRDIIRQNSGSRPQFYYSSIWYF
jgi:hypothetical protein